VLHNLVYANLYEHIFEVSFYNVKIILIEKNLPTAAGITTFDGAKNV
jgi:hypothetical protein